MSVCCRFPEVVVIIGTSNRPISAQLCAHPRVCSALSNRGALQKVGVQKIFFHTSHFQFASGATGNRHKNRGKWRRSDIRPELTKWHFCYQLYTVLWYLQSYILAWKWVSQITASTLRTMLVNMLQMVVIIRTCYLHHQMDIRFECQVTEREQRLSTFDITQLFYLRDCFLLAHPVNSVSYTHLTLPTILRV